MHHKSRRAAMVVATLLAGLALQGCSAPGGPPPSDGGHMVPKAPPTPCNPGICKINVTVNDCMREGGITVDPDFVSVSMARNMRWVIVTPGFEFAPNGIVFDPPNAQFEPQNSPTTSEFRIRNLKTQAGDFYYYVNVDGCRRVDPWIRNN